MPPLDEVNLPVQRVVVDLVWVRLVARGDQVGVHGRVSFVVPQHEGIFFTRHPALIARELQHAVLVKLCGCVQEALFRHLRRLTYLSAVC